MSFVILPVRWIVHNCPRCNGAMYFEEPHWVCINCSYTIYGELQEMVFCHSGVEPSCSIPISIESRFQITLKDQLLGFERPRVLTRNLEENSS
jgi:hypothetical protein